MLNFEYYTPTKVVFGKDAEKNIGKLILECSSKKILLHYGGGSVKKSGLLDNIKKILEENRLEYIELGCVKPNPRLSLVYEGIELGKKENVDFVLAVGGGSVIDSAKAIAYGIKNEGDVWDFFAKKRTACSCLPIGVVLTIAAAGSEMSNSSVITKEDGWIKCSYNDNLSRPKFAVMNPYFTLTLPDYQTACGCVDILMHTMERYFVPTEAMEITDSIAEALMKTVMANAKVLKKEPKNYNARAEIMWAGSLSHNGLTGCGQGNGDWATHGLEHELSAMFDVAHGAGLAAIWGSWARYVYLECLPRFKKFATNVMGIETGASDEDIALKGIHAMEDFYRSIDMPTSIKELKLSPTEKELELMAHKCSITAGGSKGIAKVLHENDMLEIYKMANK
ncbi:MAG: iron-containing alcohol dehydrogenase [Treponema sp.]